MRLAYKGLDKLEPYKRGLCLIPVCPSCNTIVNKYIFKDIEDKSTFVKRSITRKIEKHLCGSKIDHDWLNSFNKRLFWEVKNNPNWEELSRISIPVLIAPVR
jgi:hypothetical protein